MLKLLKNISIFIVTISVVASSAACDRHERTEENGQKSYLLILMRINEKLCEENTYIFPENEAAGYFRVVRGWAKNNPLSKNLYLCYNSKSVTEKQIEKTKNRIFDKSSSEYKEDADFVNCYDSQFNADFGSDLKEDSACHIICLDIHEIPIVQENEDVFSEKISIYPRVDSLRAIVADHLVKNKGETGYIVYSDFNVPWMSYNKLFKPRLYEARNGMSVREDTSKDLDEIGLVLAENNRESLSGKFPFENGFFILNGAKESMVKACRLGLIDIHILRAKQAIKMGSNLQDREAQQCVFSSYSNVIKLFYYFNLTGKIIDDPHGNPKTISERLNSYDNCTDLFDIDKPGRAQFKLEVVLKDICGHEITQVYEEDKSMAELLSTKQVEKPISSFYTTLNRNEEARRKRDNERLRYIGILK